MLSGHSKVLYLKSPFVDLTPRLQQSITEAGIVFPDADVPAGAGSFE